MGPTLVSLLDSIPQKSPRSKLETHRELIRQLRRKGCTYRDIVRILHERVGLDVAVSTIHSFIKVRAKHRKQVQYELPPLEPKSSVTTRMNPEDVASRIAALKAKPIEQKAKPKHFHFEESEPQKEISEASYQYQRAAEAREKVIVGVNEFVIEQESPHILYIGETVAPQQSAKLKTLRARRSNEAVNRALEALKKAAAQEPHAGTNGNVSSANTMPYIVDAVRAYATVGEICEALRQVYGTYTEVSIT